MPRAGTAYIEIHGDLGPLRRELKAFMAGTGAAEVEVKGDLKPLRRDLDGAQRGFGGLDRSANRFNRTLLATRNIASLVKFPALISGAGFAAQAFSALAAGTVALSGALAPLSGALVAYPALLGAVGQTAGVVALAGIKDLTEAMGGNKEALERLTPPAKRFLNTLKTFKPQLDRLRASVQAPLFAGLERGLRSAAENFPVLQRALRGTARVLGDLAAAFGRLVGSKGFGQDLGKILGRNNLTISRLGRSGLNLADAFRHILVAAGPLIGFMTKMVVRGSRLAAAFAKQGRESGRLAGFFRQTRDVLQSLGSITQSVAAGLLAIGSAGAPLGRTILKDIDKVAQRFEDWAESLRGQNQLGEFFSKAKGPLYETVGLVSDLAKAFLTLGVSPGVQQLIAQMRTLVPTLKDVIDSTTQAFGPALVDALRNILLLIGDLAGTNGPLTAFVRTLGFMAGVLHTLLSEVPGLRLLVVTLVGLKAVMVSLQFAAAATGMKALAGATGLTTVATRTYTGSLLGQQAALLKTTAATRIATAAQLSLNVALRASPYVAAATALGVSAFLIVKHWNQISKAGKDAIEFIKDHPYVLAHGPFVIAAGIIGGKWRLITQAAQTAFNALKSGTTSAWRSIKETFTSGAASALSVLRRMAAPAGDIGKRIGQALTLGFRSRLGAIRAVADEVVGVIKRIPDRLGRIGEGIFNAIKSGLSGRTLIPRIKVPVPFAPDPTIGPIKIPTFAKGGKVRRKVPTLVGEEGPELAHLPARALKVVGAQGPEIVKLPVGTRVHSHTESVRMLRSAVESRRAQPLAAVAGAAPVVPSQPRPRGETEPSTPHRSLRGLRALAAIRPFRGLYSAPPTGVEQGRESPRPLVSRALQGLSERLGIQAFRRGGTVRFHEAESRAERRSRRRSPRLFRPRTRRMPLTTFHEAESEAERREKREEERRQARQRARKEKRQEGRKVERIERRKTQRQEARRLRRQIPSFRQGEARGEQRSKRLNEMRLRTGLGGITPYGEKHGESEAETIYKAGIPKHSILRAAFETLQMIGPGGVVGRSGQGIKAVGRSRKFKPPGRLAKPKATWNWTDDEQLSRYGMTFSSGGDAVPGGYNGYYVARNADGETMGRLNYQMADDDQRKALIAMVEVKPKFRRQGVAKKLKEWAEREQGFQLRPGYTTPEGSAWWKSVGNRKRDTSRKRRRLGGKFAEGGIIKRLKEVLVGEQGPELVRLPNAMKVVGAEGPEVVSLPIGSQVFSHPESVRMGLDASSLRLGGRGAKISLASGSDPRALSPVGREQPTPFRGPSRTTFKSSAEGRIGLQAFQSGDSGKPRGPQARASGLQPAASWLASTMREKFGLNVSPQGGVRPGDDGFHGSGRAVDLVGAKMRQGAAWVKSSGLYKTLLEGIHNPNLSVDNGKLVSSGFWGGSTWAGHRDHIHLAAESIRESVKEKVKDGTDEKKAPRLTGRLSLGQMVTLAKQAGFPDPALAAAIGYVESKHGQIGAHNTKGEDSRGLWQINVAPNANPKYKNWDLFNPFRNAKAAYEISEGGKDFTPWTVYTAGLHKRFLGAKGKPLPSAKSGGGRQGQGGDSYADYIALRLDETEDTPTLRDDLRWINKGLRYWRGVYRRNKRAGNHSRALEARGNIKTLRDQKKEIRDEETPEELYELGGLSKIGTGPNAFNIGGMQRVFDQIENETAKAGLTVPSDSDESHGGLVASLQDDIGAATKLRDTWDGLYKLTTGHFIPFPTQPSSFTPTPSQRRQLNATRSQQERITLLNKFAGEPKGTWIKGTQAQETEAATSLTGARDALKSLMDEVTPAKPEGVEGPTAAERGADVGRLLASLRDLLREHGANYKRLPSFGGGGIVPGARGEPITATVHGQEIIVDPRTGDKLDMREFIKQLVEAMGPSRDAKVVNVDARPSFQEVPSDPHTFSKALAFELEAAI